MNEKLYNEFIDICKRLNEINIIPLLMGSLGLEYISDIDWNPGDIDIHVPGDKRGWEAADEDRIFNFDKIQTIMEDMGYVLEDIHEHSFIKDNVLVEFGGLDTLPEFANVDISSLEEINKDGAKFLVPSLEDYLKIYEASSKDSYRNENNNNKDFVKIEYLRKKLRIS